MVFLLVQVDYNRYNRQNIYLLYHVGRFFLKKLALFFFEKKNTIIQILNCHKKFIFYIYFYILFFYLFQRYVKKC